MTDRHYLSVFKITKDGQPKTIIIIARSQTDSLNVATQEAKQIMERNWTDYEFKGIRPHEGFDALCKGR